MIQYGIRRLVAAVPVVFGVLLLVFILARAIPGDTCRAILGEKATVAACEAFNVRKGLDKPVPVQFGYYLRDLAQGDLGDSLRFGRPVTEIMGERLPLTVELSLAALTIALVVGIPLGIIAALRRNSSFDVATMVGANIGVSMPVFWLGLMLAFLFALVLKDTPFALPPSGRLSAGVIPVPFFEVYGWEIAESGPIAFIMTFIGNMFILNSILTLDLETLTDASRHLILPAIALATIPMAILARMSRSSMLEVLGQDYVRTAKAKGLKHNKVVMKHAWRNALLPVITIAGLQMGLILSGAVLTESIFGLAGVGRALFEGITARDFPIIQGFVLFIAIGYVSLNLLIDLSYSFLDPRIRLD
jgi:peptide/nickel transport system permease protein